MNHVAELGVTEEAAPDRMRLQVMAGVHSDPACSCERVILNAQNYVVITEIVLVKTN